MIYKVYQVDILIGKWHGFGHLPVKKSTFITLSNFINLLK